MGDGGNGGGRQRAGRRRGVARAGSASQAIGAGAPTLAYDVVFNREVLGAAGGYFSDEDAVAREVDAAEATASTHAARRAATRARAVAYDWDDVAGKYELLCRDLAERVQVRARRPLTVQRIGTRGALPLRGEAVES